MAEEHELNEVPIDALGAGEDRIQESFVTDAAAAVGALGGVGGIVSGFSSYASYRIARDDHADYRAELEAQYEADRRAADLEYRMLLAQTQGLDALDRYDGVLGVEEDDDGAWRPA